MSAPREIELKLECTGADLGALAAHPLLQGAWAEPELLASTYFDTADRVLRAAGVTLRVRHMGERRVQTVKASNGASAGLFDRAEWETPITGDRPDRTALDGTPAADLLDAEAVLEPQFTTVVRRRELPLAYGSSRIAVTLDEGRVETPVGDAPLSELELELESGGDPADLFALAQALAETVPLRLGASSKSSRGFALIAGEAIRPRKAGETVIEPDADAAAAFRTIAHGCLRHLRRNEDAFSATRDPEGLHQIRVALRRLRSAFSLFKPILEGDPQARALQDEIKRVTEPFGRARNIDVFLETTLPAEMARRPDEPGLAALRDRLFTERESAYATVFAILDSPAWRGLLIDLIAWIETGAWQGPAAAPAAGRPARELAAMVLGRFQRRIRKRGRHLAKLDPEARHQVRIAAKKLRYGADFFGGLFPERKARKRQKTFGAALSDLQDHLGALNDRATAHAVLAGLADGEGADMPALAIFAAGLTAADNEADTGGLLDKAEEAYDDLTDARPFWK